MNPIRRIMSFIGVGIAITACQSQAMTPPPANIAIERAAASNLAVIEWTRSPETVVFRADVEGGYAAQAPEAARAVPMCTIYGDGRVVWVNPLAPFQREVLYDRLTPDVIADFIAYLTVNERIYTYPTPLPDAPITDAVVETVRIHVNGIDVRSNGFSGWEAEWFQRVIGACRTLSSAPVLFEPVSGWLSAAEVPYERYNPALTWDASALMVDLAQIAAAGEPSWVTGSATVTAWRAQNSQPSQFVFQQGDRYYRTVLQVPGISRTSPPAP
jgi:hypothetical protein